MARKTLLTESEVRRFMKLANMGPLGAERLDEISYLDEADEEEELHATEDELGHEDHVADEEGEELGSVTQSNVVPVGALDGPWGNIAHAVADGGAEGVVVLLREAYRSRPALKSGQP